MKKYFALFLAVCVVFAFAGCTGQNDTTNKTDGTETADDAVVEETEEPSGPVAFADVGMGLMDATEEYKEFTFEEGEGTCMDMGFPDDLVYLSSNLIKTKDESYVEDMTFIDFTGRVGFDEVPLTDGPAECEMKVVREVTTANLTCSRGEEDALEEVCTATFKVYAHK